MTQHQTPDRNNRFNSLVRYAFLLSLGFEIEYYSTEDVKERVLLWNDYEVSDTMMAELGVLPDPGWSIF